MDNNKGIFSGKVSLEKDGFFAGGPEEALAPGQEQFAEPGSEREESGQVLLRNAAGDWGYVRAGEARNAHEQRCGARTDCRRAATLRWE